MARKFWNTIGKGAQGLGQGINRALTSAGEVKSAIYSANEEGNKMIDGVVGRVPTPDWGDLDSVVSAGKQLMDSLIGAAPGTADDLRHGQAFDLQMVFDEIHANNFCTFDDKMGAFMNRLMSININEHEITLAVLGQNAAYNGDSTLISADIPRPSYAEGRNYLDYVDAVNYGGYGDMTTRRKMNMDTRDYSNGNELYETTEFLYPDDNGTGTFRNKWDVSRNRNSLLYKTKRLFEERKIKTLISRFGSDADSTSVDLDYTARKGNSTGGESRGRNLLNRGRNGHYNGYNNPYCRVWTHHHRYDKLNKLIRPFTGADGEGAMPTNLEEMHGYFAVTSGDKNRGKEQLFDITKDNGKVVISNKGWKYSVLSHDGKSNYTGFVNIAPKFLGGAEMNIHPKQCMFSIENLAWRGYNPYEFEKALSWEQRGPLGGRIMWFPPYGLSFTETSNARWSNNTFIGRGEDVYTYINTQRSGNLSFLMVIDHPSVLDYATWHEGGYKQWGGDTAVSGGGITDEEILQFFAGCDTANPNDETNSLFGKAQPTPLTDEYTQEVYETEVSVKPELTPKPAEPKEEPETKPEDSPNGVEKVEFYIFFPNNYSGAFDGEGKKNPNVDPIWYLMSGKGAQHKGGSDVKITEYNDNGSDNPGYEMDYPTGVGAGKDYNSEYYIDGPSVNVKKKTIQRKWMYRIDTTFVKNNLPKGDTRLQVLCGPESYKDCGSHFLNSNIDELKKQLNIQSDTLYSAAVVIAALTKTDALKERAFGDKDKYDSLVEFFSKEGITVTVEGHASLDGQSKSRGTEPNSFLATNRAQTVIDWVVKYLKNPIKNEIRPSTENGTRECKNNKESSIESKKTRYAKVTLSLGGESSTTNVQSNGNANSENKSAQQVANDDPELKRMREELKKLLNQYNTKVGELNGANNYKFLKDYYESYNRDENDGKFGWYQNDGYNHLGFTTVTMPLVGAMTTKGGYRKLYFDENNNLNGYYEGDTPVKNSRGEIISGTTYSAINGKECEKDENGITNITACVDYYAQIRGKVVDELPNDATEIFKSDYFKEYFGSLQTLVDEGGILCVSKQDTSAIDNVEDINCQTFTTIDNKYYCINETEVWKEGGTWSDAKILKTANVGGTIYDLHIPDFPNVYAAARRCANLEKEINSVKEQIKGLNDSISERSKTLDEIAAEKQNVDAANKSIDGVLIDFNETCLKPKTTKTKAKTKTTSKKSNKKKSAKKAGTGDSGGETDGNKNDETTKKEEQKSLYVEGISNNTLTDEQRNTLINLLDADGTPVTCDRAKREEFKKKYDGYKQNVAESQQKISAAQGKLDKDANATAANGEEINKDATTTTEDGQGQKTTLLKQEVSKYVGYNPIRLTDKKDGKTNLYRDIEKGEYWIEKPDGTLVKLDMKTKTRFKTNGKGSPADEEGEAEYNTSRYDQEYYFFRKLEHDNPIVFERLVNKLKYFDPAFHSMTPEGFNARLTFLNQCTRQGNTITMSDVGGKTANNLAFGRPPFCVLRLGDFYNQMIVINSISLDYSVSDGILWDLNPEGAGVQPMLCRVNMNFNFIGGGDMAGPIRRLQNAMSFNYYANTRLYDNRADRVRYKSENNYVEMGAVDWDIDPDNSYSYNAAFYNKEREFMDYAREHSKDKEEVQQTTQNAVNYSGEAQIPVDDNGNALPPYNNESVYLHNFMTDANTNGNIVGTNQPMDLSTASNLTSAKTSNSSENGEVKPNMSNWMTREMANDEALRNAINKGANVWREHWEKRQ